MKKLYHISDFIYTRCQLGKGIKKTRATAGDRYNSKKNKWLLTSTVSGNFFSEVLRRRS